MTVFILDFEASSLLPESFPIEIAWVREDGHGETHLIRPADSWLDAARGNPSWNSESERVHGIALESLLRDGQPAKTVAKRAAVVLGSPTALTFSDSPSDSYWLQRLMDAGAIRRTISILDVQTLYGWSCRPLTALLPPSGDSGRGLAEQRIRSLAREIVARAEEAEHLAKRTRHRALPDALSLWRTRETIKAEVQRRLREAGL